MPVANGVSSAMLSARVCFLSLIGNLLRNEYRDETLIQKRSNCRFFFSSLKMVFKLPLRKNTTQLTIIKNIPGIVKPVLCKLSIRIFQVIVLIVFLQLVACAVNNPLNSLTPETNGINIYLLFVLRSLICCILGSIFGVVVFTVNISAWNHCVLYCFVKKKHHLYMC